MTAVAPDPHAREGDADVLIVGAGLAGLTAATRLQSAGMSVVTLEARHEVGGRLRSRKLGGTVVDLGGEFVGPHHRRLKQLASDVGVSLEDSGLSRARTLWRIDQRKQRVGYLPRLSPSELFQAQSAVRELATLARKVPVEEPWKAEEAAALDALSVREWLERRGVRGRAYRLFAAMLEGLATTRLDRLSLLHVLWWIARAGGPLGAMRDVNAMRLRGGGQELCRRLAAGLAEPVRLGTPVRRIRHDDAGVKVKSREGVVARGRYAIVCVPFPAMSGIACDPPLPEAQQALHREVGFGRATSVVVKAGVSARSRHGIVVGGHGLPLAWRTDGGAKGLFLDDGDAQGEPPPAEALCALFGLDGDTAKAEMVPWADEPFIGGTYVVFEPGQLTRHGPELRRPHGRVHFAGAERGSWPDSMEGAVESGTWMADQVGGLVQR